MRKMQSAPHKLVERLEKKYQKKARFQRYKSLSRQLRQNLSQVHGVPVDVVKDENSFSMFNTEDYEYIR